MYYNWKCCSFYPNNFGASALQCAFGCRPLACGRVSTGQWKHVTLASGNMYTGLWTTMERAKLINYPTAIYRKSA